MNDQAKQNKKPVSDTSNGSVNTMQLLRWMFGSWKVIAGVATLVTGAAIFYALTATEIYLAEVLLVPVIGEKNTGSGLSHLLKSSVMDGMSFSSSQKNHALATLKSRKFLGRFIKEKNLLPILFENQWDENSKEWKIKSGAKHPTEALAFHAFSGLLDLNEESKTGLITLSVFWKDPQLAAEWANELIRYLNEDLRMKAIDDSKKKIGYLEKELSKTKIRDMKEILYSLLESEESKSMLANVNEEFALAVIDPAVVPEERVKPNRRLIAICGGFGGLFLGAFTVFLLEFLRDFRSSSSF
jgi:uncharacterized protein involved in exopolysaccharide biosynthesis